MVLCSISRKITCWSSYAISAVKCCFACSRVAPFKPKAWSIDSLTSTNHRVGKSTPNSTKQEMTDEQTKGRINLLCLCLRVLESEYLFLWGKFEQIWSSLLK